MYDSDQLAFVWRAGRIFKSVFSLGAFAIIRGWPRSRWQLRFHWGLGDRRRWCSRFGHLFPTYAREVGAEALHRNNDVAFLFEPLADACQALPIGNGSSDLGPKSANLAGFCRRLFPAPLCEAQPGFGDPLLLGLCVFFALCHDSTVYDVFRQFSTIFDT